MLAEVTHGLCGERPPGIGPLEGFCQGIVEVVDKVEEALAKCLGRGEMPTAQHPPYQDAEPDFNLVEPRGVFWGVDPANSMVGIFEEGGARFHGLQNTGLPFDAQGFFDTACGGNVPNQGFGLMGIELISDKDPGAAGVASHGLADMLSKVGFGAGGLNGW